MHILCAFSTKDASFVLARFGHSFMILTTHRFPLNIPVPVFFSESNYAADLFKYRLFRMKLIKDFEPKTWYPFRRSVHLECFVHQNNSTDNLDNHFLCFQMLIFLSQGSDLVKNGSVQFLLKTRKTQEKKT